jgi:hypothetical protein
MVEEDAQMQDALSVKGWPEGCLDFRVKKSDLSGEEGVVWVEAWDFGTGPSKSAVVKLPQPGWGYMGMVRVKGVWGAAHGGSTFATAPDCIRALRAMHPRLKDEDIRAAWVHPGDDRCACQGEWGKCETCGGVGYV